MQIGKNTLNGQKLLKFIERIEAKERVKKGAADDIAVIYADLKRDGFNAEATRAMVKVRKLKPSKFRERQDVFDLYLHAIGMAPELPLFKHVETLGRDAMGRDALIERMKDLVPRGGAITVDVGGEAPVRISRDKDGAVSVEDVQPEPEERGGKGKGKKAKGAPKAPVPDVDEAGAERLGRAAAKGDKPIIDNPFPFGDPRQRAWDRGWRAESGNDGMGPPGDDEGDEDGGANGDGGGGE